MKKASRNKRRVFSPELKQEAVRLLQDQRKLGGSVAQVGRELGVGPELLRRWEREQHCTVPLREWSPLQQELKELRREWRSPGRPSGVRPDARILPPIERKYAL